MRLIRPSDIQRRPGQLSPSERPLSQVAPTGEDKRRAFLGVGATPSPQRLGELRASAADKVVFNALASKLAHDTRVTKRILAKLFR